MTSLDETFKQFKESYISAALDGGLSKPAAEKNFATLYRLTLEEMASPFHFSPYHERVRAPFDYYQFGLDFIRPLIKLKESRLLGKPHLERILKQLAEGKNVILLANHQTEPDPQIISILLEKEHPQFVEEMIFVAGHRVVTDPLAIPFSKGRNLLCIHSKRYIEHPPELREEKILHNRRTLERLKQLLQGGGKCIYVAPSGGRDRTLADGTLQLAPFDPASLELFRLVAKDTPTHFYPLAMHTYALLPPPETIQTQLGEERYPSSVPVALNFGEEVDMDHFSGAPVDKHEKREARALYIWKCVNDLYTEIKT